MHHVARAMILGGGGAKTLVNQAAWTSVYESDKQQFPATLADGTAQNFATWKDKKTGIDLVPASSGFAQRTFDGALQFTNDPTQRVRRGGVSLTSGTDFAICARFYHFDSATWIPVAFDTNGASNNWLYIDIGGNFIQVSITDGVIGLEITDFVTLELGNPYVVFVERTGTTLRLQVDARAPITGSGATDLTVPNNISIGNLVFSGPTNYLPGNGGVTDVGWKTGAAFTAGERSAILAYFANRFRPWKVPGNVGAWDVRKELVAAGSTFTSWNEEPKRTNRSIVVPGGYTAPVYNVDDGDGKPAIRFAGGADPTPSGELVRLAGFAPYLDLDNDFGFAAVVYIDATTDGGGLFGFGIAGLPQGRITWFVITPPNGIFAQLLNETANNTTAVVTPTTNNWHFIWSRRIGANFTLGINGDAEVAATVPAGSFAADELTLGGTLNNVPPVQAFIAKERVRAFAAFNRDIGLAQIQQLRAYWKTQFPGLP